MSGDEPGPSTAAAPDVDAPITVSRSELEGLVANAVQRILEEKRERTTEPTPGSSKRNYLS